MAKLLSGSELAGFIKERQAKQVRNLRQQFHIVPRLLIIQSISAAPAIQTYVRMKMAYAQDILIEVETAKVDQNEMADIIKQANQNASIHGIIVQLPLDIPDETDSIVNLIAPEKDVDGLGVDAQFISATAEAIDWLLTGYNIALAEKSIVLIGRGRLVGAPLELLWRGQGYNVTSVTKESSAITETVKAANIVVSAAGVPRLVTQEMIAADAVVVDAATASEDGKLVGDVDPEVRNMPSISITLEKGGVGPLTIAVMFDHVIRSALRTAGQL